MERPAARSRAGPRGRAASGGHPEKAAGQRREVQTGHRMHGKKAEAGPRAADTRCEDRRWKALSQANRTAPFRSVL